MHVSHGAIKKTERVKMQQASRKVPDHRESENPWVVSINRRERTTIGNPQRDLAATGSTA